MVVIDRINQILDLLETKVANLRVSANQINIMHGISDISKKLGLFQTGEIRMGNSIEPGFGFSGVRIGFPTFSYDSDDWVFAAVASDVIQFGIRKDGTLMTSLDQSNMSAFNTLETGELTPIIQGDFTHGINTQQWQTTVVSGAGATVDTNASRLRIQSGTAAAGYAYILSRRPARYRAGQGTTARFTPLFTSGVASNIQLWGMLSISSGLPYDAYMIGYNGTSLGIVHYVRGVATWIPQTEWNGNQCLTASDGFVWDATLGSPFQIKYPYLGFGNITFWIQSPVTSRWVLIHTIRYANTTSSTQLSNPNLYFGGFTLNSGNTTNVTMYCGSVGIFLSGARSFTGNPRGAADRTKNGITTETNIFSIRNCSTYNGSANRGLIRLNSISFASSIVTAVATMRLKIGATLGGVPAYTPYNGTTADNGVTITSGNSVASMDVAGTTVTGGSYIYNLSVVNSGITLDLTELDLYIAPGETLTISGSSTSSSNLSVSLNWTEDI